MKSPGQIVAKSGVGGLRIMFCLQLSFIDANEFLSFASLFAKAVVSDPVEPRRKTRLAAEAAEILVRAQESFLGQIVREGDIRPDQLAQQTAHARLMISDQLRKGVVIVIKKDSSDEVCIG